MGRRSETIGGFGKSIANRRRGHKAWATRLKREAETERLLIDAEIARKAWEQEHPEICETGTWQIQRKAKGYADAMLSFTQFVAEIRDWSESPNHRGRVKNPAFSVFEDAPLTGSIAQILASGARIVTAKAEYELVSRGG